MRKTLAASIIALFAVACSGAAIQVNPDVKFPLAASDETPAFLFPINMSHLGSGGDPLLMGVSVTAGMASHFGKKVISGQQLFDLVGNLSYELAEQIQSQVMSKSFQMTGPAEMIATALAKIMEAIIGKLVDLKLLEKPIKFKYIIALHSHGSSAMGGTMLSVDSWGGIYDSETKQILSYIASKDNYPNKPETVMAQLPMAYNKIVDQLLQGNAPAEEKKDAKPEEKKEEKKDAPTAEPAKT